MYYLIDNKSNSLIRRCRDMASTYDNINLVNTKSALKNEIKGTPDVYLVWDVNVDGNSFVCTLYCDGTVTIYGNGVISFEDYNTNVSLWNNPDNAVPCLRAIIGEGVTGLGDYIFNECTNLMGIELPDGLTSIGKYACYNTNILSLDLPDSVETIGDNAFNTGATLTANAT